MATARGRQGGALAPRTLVRGWLAVALLTLAAVGVAATSDPKDHGHNYPQAEQLYPSPGVAAGSLDDCEQDDTCEDFQYPTLDNEDN